jgi:hypothetical protein
MLWCQSGRHEDACEAYKGDYELAGCFMTRATMMLSTLLGSLLMMIE